MCVNSVSLSVVSLFVLPGLWGKGVLSVHASICVGTGVYVKAIDLVVYLWKHRLMFTTDMYSTYSYIERDRDIHLHMFEHAMSSTGKGYYVGPHQN